MTLERETEIREKSRWNKYLWDTITIKELLSEIDRLRGELNTSKEWQRTTSTSEKVETQKDTRHVSFTLSPDDPERVESIQHFSIKTTSSDTP